MAERDDIIESLGRHRGFPLQTAEGLSEEQARTASTVSALTVASLLKHVADTEEQWVDFARRGADAFGGSGESQGGGEDGWVDTRFVLDETETLERLRARVEQVAEASEALSLIHI